MSNNSIKCNETKIELFGLNQVSRLEKTWDHPYGEAWCRQHHTVGLFFSGRDWETSQDHGTVERRNP